LRRIQELYKPLIDRLIAKTIAIEMYQRDALLFSELENIQACQTPSKAAEELLKVLLQQPYNDESVFECFLEALKHTSQYHIFLWISNKGMVQNISLTS
jgi:hypothetical protein